MSAGIKYVTDASFEQDVLNSDKPVLLDFWAEWCGPCKMIGPILEELSGEYGDKIQIAKMNVDENQGVPAQFNIRGIPDRNDIYELLNGKKSNNFKIQITTSSKFAKNI